ncbi:sugar transferase, partial [Campylobacter jejuni]
MLNPNSAIERVKNHLAYKLGQTVIEHRHNGGGYIALFKKLYKIKKQHKKEQKIYQQTIQIFPQLKYPSLETCGDYEQALRYKFHLSYMLGEVLIKADKTWHKGSGFKLKNDIKKANKEFKIFKEIFNNFAKLSPNIIKIISKNKQAFLKELPRIQNILKIHQDYQPILDNIFHNFNYFIQNFNLIEEWLLSNDFNEKYKKENHPYPSLLDPKKLNDENEKINYKNIPAELAWEMNLPLPDGYKFNLFTFGLTGHSILLRALVYHGVRLQWYSNDYKMLYLDNFEHSYDCIHILFLDRNDFNKSFKYINLLPRITTIFLIRDPISKFKTGLNHGGYKKGCNSYDIVDSNIPIQKILDRVQYPFFEQITLEHMLNYWINHGVWRYDSIIKNICKEKIYFLDMEELMPNKILSTFVDLKFKFKLNNIDNLEIMQNIIFGPYRYILPLIINFSFENINIKVYIELKDRVTNGNINLNCMLKYKHDLLQDIVFSISELDFEYLNNPLIKQINDFQKDFLDVLNKKIKDIEN